MSSTNPKLINPAYIYSIQCSEKKCDVMFVGPKLFGPYVTVTAEKEFEQYKFYNAWYNRVRQSNQWIQNKED